MGTLQAEGQGAGTGVLAPPRRSGRGAGARPKRRRRAGPPDPPDRGDDSGDSGSGGGGGGPPQPGPPGGTPPDASSFALWLGLVGIGTLFLVFLFVWALLLRSSAEWPPGGIPDPPHSLWASTAALVLCSLALARAVRREEQGRVQERRRLLAASLALGTGFLVSQATLGALLVRDGVIPSTNGYAAIFYALVGLHALHVAGGIAALLWVMRSRHGARLCARYWHFMGAIWVVLFAALYLVR